MSYLNRKKNNPLPDLENFRSMVNGHWFSYEFVDPKTQGSMRNYVRALDYEANVLFPIAWAGGDEYMDVLAERVAAHNKRLQEPSPVQKLINQTLAAVDPELDEFMGKLAYFDWTWRYSDSIEVGRRGMDSEAYISKQVAKGGLFKIAYDLEKAKRGYQ